jgi:hypothetical protein
MQRLSPPTFFFILFIFLFIFLTAGCAAEEPVGLLQWACEAFFYIFFYFIYFFIRYALLATHP